MRGIVWSRQFRRDVRTIKRRGKDLSKLDEVLQLLVTGAPLPPRLRDHPLRGGWKGFRDLHVEPDWLQLYRVQGDDVLLARTGTHSDLFD